MQIHFVTKDGINDLINFTKICGVVFFLRFMILKLKKKRILIFSTSFYLSFIFCN